MVLKFLICGMEHTGTTLISDLFRQIPGLDAGFECGVLLDDTPARFRDRQPFAENILSGWGITQSEFDHCCDAPDFTEFYTRLLIVSTVLEPGTKGIFDKTPRYLAHLDVVLARSDVPVIISHKDPRAIVCSDFKRAGIDDFDAWYDGYRKAKLRYVQTCYNHFMAHRDDPRVTTVGLEDLAMNARATMERMFAHAGFQFELGYAIIGKLRYENVKNRTVSADIAFEYKARLSRAAQDRIMSDFGQFEAWVYA